MILVRDAEVVRGRHPFFMANGINPGGLVAMTNKDQPTPIRHIQVRAQ